MTESQEMLVESIKSYDFGDMPSSSAEEFRKIGIEFVKQNPVKVVVQVSSAFQNILESFCKEKDFEKVSVDEYFKPLEDSIQKTDPLFISVKNYISREVINMTETIGRDNRFDKIDLVMDLVLFMEMISLEEDK